MRAGHADRSLQKGAAGEEGGGMIGELDTRFRAGNRWSTEDFTGVT